MVRGLLTMGAMAMAAGLSTADEGKYAADKDAAAVVLKAPGGKAICRYVYGKLPADEPQTAVPVVGYLHPIWTPLGQVVTESKGGDHAWLRGVFVAWPQVWGAAKGGFWTCGKAVWNEPGRIVNAKFAATGDASACRVTATNDWLAGDARVVVEDANISAFVRDGAHVIDWQVAIHPDGNAATLKPWPFSGLTFHGRREAGEKVEIHDPNGLVKRGGSPWDKAAGNWPDAAWYDLVLTGKDGKTCGLAMIGHRDNGKAAPAGDAPGGDGRQSWNMNPGLRFMAPSVTAAKPFAVTKDRPLVLRYRLVAHDGPPPTELLNKLARE